MISWQLYRTILFALDKEVANSKHHHKYFFFGGGLDKAVLNGNKHLIKERKP